jgi:hypothetical protein
VKEKKEKKEKKKEEKEKKEEKKEEEEEEKKKKKKKKKKKTSFTRPGFLPARSLPDVREHNSELYDCLQPVEWPRTLTK